MNIDQPTATTAIAPLWRLAFRAGFLLAGAFAVLAMARWLGWIFFPALWDMTLSPQWWHAHEMLFGFVLPVVAGFLLTAVATWTGIAGTTGVTLKWLFGFWLGARVLLWLAPQWPLAPWLAEMCFIGLITKELGSRVWAKKQWRNILFVPVLLALAGFCTASYYYSADPIVSTRLHYGALWMVLVFVVIIGGRVIPLFTGNRLGLKIAPLPAWMDYLAIGSTALLAIAFVLTTSLAASPALRILCGVCGLLQAYRLAHWQGWKTRSVPLLWSMHASYLCIPLTLFGIALLGDDPIAVKNLLHLLAIGTIGGMILAMMARVSLGHTGRPLETPAGIPLAFALVFIAALIRAGLPLLLPQLTQLAWQVSGGLWLIAFALFSYRYYPILSSARPDGKLG